MVCLKFSGRELSGKYVFGGTRMASLGFDRPGERAYGGVVRRESVSDVPRPLDGGSE